jgi:hypothetical protein
MKTWTVKLVMAIALAGGVAVAGAMAFANASATPSCNGICPLPKKAAA